MIMSVMVIEVAKDLQSPDSRLYPGPMLLHHQSSCKRWRGPTCTIEQWLEGTDTPIVQETVSPNSPLRPRRPLHRHLCHLTSYLSLSPCQITGCTGIVLPLLGPQHAKSDRLPGILPERRDRYMITKGARPLLQVVLGSLVRMVDLLHGMVRIGSRYSHGIRYSLAMVALTMGK